MYEIRTAFLFFYSLLFLSFSDDGFFIYGEQESDATRPLWPPVGRSVVDVCDDDDEDFEAEEEDELVAAGGHGVTIRSRAASVNQERTIPSRVR